MFRKTVACILAALMMLWAVPAAVLPVSAAAVKDAFTAELSGNVNGLTAGGTFTVRLSITGISASVGSKLSGYDCKLTYDQSILTYKSISFFSDPAPTGWLAEANQTTYLSAIAYDNGGANPSDSIDVNIVFDVASDLTGKSPFTVAFASGEDITGTGTVATTYCTGIAGKALTVYPTADNAAPVISSAAASPTAATSGNVTVTVTASDAGIGLDASAYSFDGGVTWQTANTKTYTANTTVASDTIQVRDAFGNIAKYSTVLSIANIDRTAPVITSVVPSPTAATNGDVTVTVTASDAGAGLAAQAYSFDGGTTWQAGNTKTYTANTTIAADTVKVRDVVGNIASYNTQISISNIDKSIPDVDSIGSSPSTPTNGKVTLTVVATDNGSGLAAAAYSFDGGKTWQTANSKDYTENTEIPAGSIRVRDAAGNVFINGADLSIDNIDKTAPVITSVVPGPTAATNGDVTVTVTASDAGAGLAAQAYSFDGGTTWQSGNTKTYTANTTIATDTIKVRDVVGNIASYGTEKKIENIDKTVPSITSVDVPNAVSPSWKASVTVTVTAADADSGLAAQAYSFDGGATWQAGNTKVYTENTAIPAGTIVVRDAAGNTAAYNTAAAVERVDSKPPVIGMEYKSSDGTNATFTLSATDTDSGVAGFYLANGTLLASSASYDLVVLASGTIQANAYYAQDNMGNKAYWPSTTISVADIDTTAPVIGKVELSPKTATNGDVTVTVTATDAGGGDPTLNTVTYSFDGGTTWQSTDSKTYTANTVISSGSILVKDATGNTAKYTTEIKIENIDRTAPVITSVLPDTTAATNGDVTITVTASDAGSGLADKAYSFDGGATWQAGNTKAYSANTWVLPDTIVVRDAAGNTASYHTAISITNIDKDIPVVTMITASPLIPTSGNVTVTVMASDMGSGLAAAAYSFDGGKTWQTASTKDYSENTVIPAGSIRVRDAAGNEFIYNTEEKIDNIDKTAPVIASALPGPTAATNGDVTITVTASDAGAGLADEAYSFDGGATWQAGNTKAYTANTTIAADTIKVCDAVGNIASYGTEIKIENIDKTNPTVTSVLPDTTAATNGNVTVTVTASDAGAGLAAEAYSFDGGTTWQADNTKVYTANTTITADTVKVRDAVGNIASYSTELVIENIDKTAPTILFGNFFPTTPTNGNVKAGLSAWDGGSGLADKAYSFDGGVTWEADSTKEYTENTVIAAGTFKVRDKAGNIRTYDKDIVIDNIDKIPPAAPTDTFLYKTDSGAYILKATAAESNCTLNYSYFNGTETVKDLVAVKNGVNNIQLSGISQLSGDITVTLTDGAGNISAGTVTSLASSVYIEAPVVTMAAPAKGTDAAGISDITLPAGAKYTCTGIQWDAGLADGKYKPATKYTVTVTLTADAGYAFIDIAEISGYIVGMEGICAANINGNMVENYTIDGNKLILTYAFPTTAANVQVFPGNVSITSAGILVTAPAIKAAPVSYAISLGAFSVTSLKWEPVTDAFDYSTAYRITAVLTAASNAEFAANTAAYVNNAQAVIVSNTGKTLTVTYTFPRTESGLTAADIKPVKKKTLSSGTFSDLTPGAWYESSVKFVYEYGLFEGTDGGKFDPDSPMTRAMFVTVLSRLAGVDTSGYKNSGAYSDVKDDSWYTGAVMWAVKLGIIEGTGDGRIGADDEVTREQMCVMLLRFADAIGLNLGTSGSSSGFADNDKISSWAADAVSVFAKLGIVNGKENNSFDPTGDATRAQVAAIFERFTEKYFIG